MKRGWIAGFSAVLLWGQMGSGRAQVYSPVVTKQGQVDTTSLKTVAAGIYAKYHAHTDREKAEAIWRFYLTDGRFVKPGMFYHLAGWAYEEPNGQVLDPVKLLNSYGYGLCYQDGPLMAATFKAGGFRDARVWFLTGHTVAEVFYDGQYHYFDSDMLGYNPIGDGPLKERDVASVYQLEHNPNIILKNVTGPTTSNPKTVDYPWYPADVHANAMGDLASLFSTTQDNYLYAYTRYPQGHTMDFVLRPGETMVRYFVPTPANLFYLPYTKDGKQRALLPDLAQFHIPVAKGPHSEKDYREWATGKILYRPQGTGDAVVARHGKMETVTFDMPSPYVIIDANFSVQVKLKDKKASVLVETSTDDGHTWAESARLAGPYDGVWKAQPTRLPAEYNRLNAVAGSYGYQVRYTVTGARSAMLTDFSLTTLFQLNPRTLPAVTAGDNVFDFRAGDTVRREIPVRASRLQEFAAKIKNARYVSSDGQGYWVNDHGKPAEMIFALQAKDGDALTGLDVGGRFLDLRQGIAPNKFTAEVRKVTPWPADAKGPGAASIAWSESADGPWTTLWSYDPKLTWLDGQPIPQVLRWPEVDRSVRTLPAGTLRVYVRYRIDGLAIDHFRLATLRAANPAASQRLTVTQEWTENGQPKSFQKTIADAKDSTQYLIHVPKDATVKNVALIMECPAGLGASSMVAAK